MNIRDLKKKARYYKPAIWTDRVLRFKFRRALLKTISAILFILICYYLLFVYPEQETALGALLVIFSMWAPFVAWEMFYNSLQTKDPHLVGLTPLVAKTLYTGFSRDITGSFLSSNLGKEILKRFALDAREFISSVRVKYRGEDVFVKESNFVDLSLYIGSIIEQDTTFREFLFAHAISEEQVLNLCQWLERDFYIKLAKSRWWTRDALLRVPSIGVAFAYGRAYLLEQFSLKVEGDQSDILFDYFEEELDQIEEILIRSKEANALVVGSRENLHMISLLQKKIERGNVHPQIEHKDLFVLDTEELISVARDKATFEQMFLKILKEVIHAGNIILVIEDLPAFILSAQSLGVGIVPMLEPYLASADVQVVAFSELRTYQKVLEPNEIIREKFEELLVEDKEKEIIRAITENYISFIEKNQGVFFEYKAINAIVMGIERYFVRNSPIDEVTDTLVDLAGRINELGKRVITEKDVLELFEQKTGIPMQEANQVEKEKLINLEKILHQRIIGQNDAILSIADTLRRVRSGISNPNRPMGTFLFLGPTGVGKTETAKALAANFFGSEKNIKRLDMSEFSGPDALERLIGSFETGQVGALPAMLREDPYGVLLLDEFEKASGDVHDLFLQILDEGIFSDMRGDKVNARNILIVATSNAGSDLIWQYAKEGKDVSKYEKEIVDAIVEKKIFKPELVNRFDSVVVFHPLAREHILKIAEIMMRKLSERLRAKGVEVKLSPEALETVVGEGVSSKFGARELNRVLQDRVESAVARMMLEGKIKKGDSMVLRGSDLSS